MTEHVRTGVIDIDGAEFEGIIEALESIGTGRFSWDHHEHCANTVEHAIAVRDSVVPVLRKSLVLDITKLREALEEARRDLLNTLSKCPLCGHLWSQHDPQDGQCDGPPHPVDPTKPCFCGRDLKAMRGAINLRIRAALLTEEQTDG
jgi:hypothetical protein